MCSGLWEILVVHAFHAFYIFLFRTQFTGIERYSYIDPDFALTDEETKRKQQHKKLYLNYIRDSRTYRDLKGNKRYFS